MLTNKITKATHYFHLLMTRTFISQLSSSIISLLTYILSRRDNNSSMAVGFLKLRRMSHATVTFMIVACGLISMTPYEKQGHKNSYTQYNFIHMKNIITLTIHILDNYQLWRPRLFLVTKTNLSKISKRNVTTSPWH